MKKILLIVSAFMLNGCLYSFEDECIKPIIQVVSNSCHKNKGKEFPLVAGYQKKVTLGRTNTEQRWKDLIILNIRILKNFTRRLMNVC